MKARPTLEDLRDQLDATIEWYGETLTQYQSECALYGDAGFGQGAAVDRGLAEIARLEAEIARLEAEIA